MTQNTRTILIIDDCLEDRETYRRYLLQDSRYTYTILEEEYGENGLELCRLVNPDAILLDFLLPDIDGLEFLDGLKTQIGKTNLPVVMLTGQGNEAIAVQAMKSGAQDYLVKGDMTPQSLRLAIHNVVERAHLKRQLERSEERFRTSVENMLDCFGIFTSIRDESGRVIDFLTEYVNAAACANNCMTQEEQIGKRMLDLLPFDRNGLLAEYCQVVETGEPLLKEALVYVDRENKQYLIKAFDIRVAKLGDGFVAAWRDITERKRTEEALRESQRFIQRIADTTPELLYIYDLRAERTVYVNRQIAELGYTPEAIDEGMVFQGLMHPDDLAKLAEHIQKFSRAEDGDILEFEYRMKHVNGEWRWFCSRDTVFTRTADGLPHQLLGTALDITERKRSESEREQLLMREQATRTTAEAANRAKDEFLSMVSHELRNPLTAILGYTQLLHTPKLKEVTVVRAIKTIERSARLQAQLIDDLLDITRITSGKLHLNMYPVELVFLIEAAIDTVQLTAEAKSIQIERQFVHTGRVLGDANRLQQVILNLLTNAIKFTPEGGRIQVQLERINGHIQLIVCDTGCGIAAEFLPYVFERFRQADSKGRYGGLGLGLTIAHQLVELHGGTVQVESPGEGQGAMFTITLPLMAIANQDSAVPMS